MFKRSMIPVFALVLLAGMPLSSLFGASADLGVTITGSASYQPGNKRTVTITVFNTGPDSSPAVNTITMPLPPAPITLTNFQQSGGTVAPSNFFPNNGNGAFQVNFPAFPSGGSSIITFDENAPVGTPIPTNYTDTVTVAHNIPDAVTTNDSASLPGSVVGTSDVSVIYTSTLGTTTGQPRTLKLTVANGGPDAAANVVLTQNAAPNTTFSSFVQNTGPTFTASGTPTNKFTIGTLASGASATFTFVETIANSAPPQITDTATVTTASVDTATGNNMATSTFTVTPTPFISVNNLAVNEGDSGFSLATFTAKLTVPTATQVTVDFATADNTAKAPKDYISQVGTIVFAPNQTTQSFTVAIVGNAVVEPDKIFTIHLTNASGAAIGQNDSVATIVNDDFGGTMQFAQANFPVAQNAGNATITVQRINGLAQDVTVDYSTSDNSAVNGTDYTAVSGTLMFNAGEASKTFDVPLLNKFKATPSATVNLILSNPTNTATLGSQSTATLTILALPAFTSPLTVNVLVNTPFSYTFAATGEAPITFTVSNANLPSGLTFSGGVISGTPTTVGSFAVPVTATNSVGSVNDLLVLNITAVPTTPGTSKTTQDSDGDGFADELEAIAGTSALDFKSTPVNNAPAQVLGISNVRLTIGINFRKKNADSVVLSGAVTLPAGFVDSGKLVYFDVGGVVRRFALDSSGSSRIGSDSVKFKLGRSIFTQTGSFKLTIRNADAVALLADEGLVDGSFSGIPVNMPVLVLLNTNLYKITQPQLYTARAGSKGKTRNP